jgi:hypothetical protein
LVVKLRMRRHLQQLPQRVAGVRRYCPRQRVPGASFSTWRAGACTAIGHVTYVPRATRRNVCSTSFPWKGGWPNSSVYLTKCYNFILEEGGRVHQATQAPNISSGRSAAAAACRIEQQLGCYVVGGAAHPAGCVGVVDVTQAAFPFPCLASPHTLRKAKVAEFGWGGGGQNA